MSLLFPSVPGGPSPSSSPRPPLDFPTSPSSISSSAFFSSLHSSNRVARDPVASTSGRIVPHVQPFPSAPRPRTDSSSSHGPTGGEHGPPISLPPCLSPRQAKQSKRLSFISALSSASSHGSSTSSKLSPRTGYSFSTTPPLSPASAPLSRSNSSQTRTSLNSGPTKQANNSDNSGSTVPLFNSTVTETMDEETCPVCCEDLSMRLQVS